MMRDLLIAGRTAAAARRLVRQAALAILLLACAAGPMAAEEPAAQVAAAATRPAPSSPQPRFTDSALIAADGASLPLRKWLPRGGVKAVILDVRKVGHRVKIILSRNHPEFVRRLFEEVIGNRRIRTQYTVQNPIKRNLSFVFVAVLARFD